MPRKIQDFAQQSLIKPVLVNVGRAGAANLDVLQVVEYVKQEAKMVYLLECLQKTPPPVIIFSENKNEVDGMLIYIICIFYWLNFMCRYSGILAPQRCWGSRYPWIENYVFVSCIWAQHKIDLITYSPGGTSICHQVLQVRCKRRHGRIWCRLKRSWL